MVERFSKLQKEIEEVKSLNISLRARAKKEEEILRDLVKEIKDLGFDPKNLKQDLDKLEKEIEEKIEAKEKEVSEVKISLEDIERNVRMNEAN